MSKNSVITALFALVALTGWAQSTKTATITGYSPALKNGTIAMLGIDNEFVATDTVIGGRFTLTVPLGELTLSHLFLHGENCPNYLMRIYLTPGQTISLTGTDCLYPLWRVDSPVAEQQTINRIMEYNRETLKEYFQLQLAHASWEEAGPVHWKCYKQEMDYLLSLPVDAVVISELEVIAQMARYNEDFPYIQQLKELETSIAARAPKGFEQELAQIHSYVYPSHILQAGEEAADAELFDMQGNSHRLFDAFADGRYVLLDFWQISCGPCIMSEPEMREVYERMKGKLEIVGINMDKPDQWKKSDFSKKITWKNWNNGNMGRGGFVTNYLDEGFIPYYVLISPDRHIFWKTKSYNVGYFMGLAEALNGPKQDNSSNLSLAVRHTSVNANGTKVCFRKYGKKENKFSIAKDSYLTANGKEYKLTSVDGIILDADNYPEVNAFTAKEDYIGDINYTDFTLTFEPFETIPETFDFKAGDVEGAFVIRNISLK